MKLTLIATLLSIGFAFQPASDEVLPLGDFGKAFLKSRFKSENPSDAPFAKLRSDRCVHGQFGIFDIAYPAWALGDKHHVEDLRDIATALIQVQLRWIDWLAKADPATVGPKGDAESLMAWIKAWKPPQFAKSETAPDKDLFVLLGATDAHKEASKRLAALIAKPDVLGVAPKNGEPMHILFAPTRRDFAELLGYAGLIDTTQQAQLWTKQAVTWTSFWIDWTLVLALEYPPWAEDKEFKTGLSMNKYEATGMLQHTVQQVMLSFLWMAYGDSDAIYLNQAQAMNMAIEVCGEINALEGDGGRGTTGAKTNAYEKFVPGGNSSGGVLPPMLAAPYDGMKSNPWHEGLGRDHFAVALRKGQKAGWKQAFKDVPDGTDPMVAKDKIAHFALVSQDGIKKYPVSAPFLGLPSKSKPYPSADFIDDYREFFRAYKCGFYYWLQAQGDKGGPELSAAKYKDLLRVLAKREPARTLDDVVSAVYGVPLSAKNGETDSLEWRYLQWLAKGS